MQTPVVAILPFALYLLAIAVLPLVLSTLWEHHHSKLGLAVLASVPVGIYLVVRPGGIGILGEALLEYLAFIALLSALFVISGGIYLRGSFGGSAGFNTAVLALGALLSSLVGTTGASVLLIRPLLRANEGRPRLTHLTIFFIFIVSNAGGLLTPLGDPPLFLGFLRGVPFLWTLRLAGPWAVVNGALLVIFYWLDRARFARDPAGPAAPREPLAVTGARNLLWLGGVLLTVLALGTVGARVVGGHTRTALQAVIMVGLLVGSLLTTPASIRQANRFSWDPMIEVAVIFVGVFVTMIPALAFVEERGTALGITRPWQFFWAAGLLSGVLDNAPTYLTFTSLAAGVADAGRGTLSAARLDLLATHPTGAKLLAALSCGAVFMGANTYLGNGPNLMVKAIAEQHGVRMPSFFGYMKWSGAILIPIFIGVGLLFF